MKTLIAFAFLWTTISCTIPVNKQNKTITIANNTIQQKIQKDTTPKVIGIGGIFFKCKNPNDTKAWYDKNLGLVINEYGSTFEFRNANRPNEINYLQWSPFKETTNYFTPSQKDFMINYRVQNIQGLIRNFRKNGVAIVDTLETYDYGKFIHILDADGNKIELWEPVDSILTALGGKTTK